MRDTPELLASLPKRPLAVESICSRRRSVAFKALVFATHLATPRPLRRPFWGGADLPEAFVLLDRVRS